MHQSFLNYRRYRYSVTATAVVVAGALLFALDRPRVPANGGTWVGYTLGTVAALLILLLALFGIRKRSFGSRLGTAIGWLSAHVYLGLAALVIATLHTGLHFGANIHTASYLLMCGVTLSGVWGVYTYLRYPTLMSRQRGPVRRKELLQQIGELDQRAAALCTELPGVGVLIDDSVRRTDLGAPGLWGQLRQRDRSCLMVGAESAARPARLVENPDNSALISELAQLRLTSPEPSARARLQSLLEIAGLKAALLRKLRGETRLAALMRLWLAIHIPLCCALLAALAAHVLAVFLYW